MTPEEKFHTLIKEFEAAMLVTRAKDGTLRSRPMAIAEVEESCDVWFVTGIESEKIQEIWSDPRVNVSFAKGSQFVSLSGTAEVVRDEHKLDEIWSPAFKEWFPEGKEDPNLVLIHLKAQEGEYWDTAGANKLKIIFRALKALATGAAPDEDAPEHARAHLLH